ncbi:methyltransferase domain-containing protein [Streptomyces sp. FXJ1.172]|jgi:ubiquinone/menaquinone biosynthesis C-methylase UbiE|uniref:methyltransferase domain-containing protein n=1 Tax=Streptomyces sp. FXJ1.172 TaxID=710705 RepID=UPI0007CF135E|nr:methyltransferase domain-containing protein [Streptomyces sp. FXJ1.172]WEO96889.1 methyltransferase domain-containing protein [Streptomyces sp. FXJ1.172]
MTSSAFETARPDSVTYLDRIAATDLGRSYKARMLDELGLQTGHTVLDLGCGPGTDLRALAEAVTPAGSVIGVDHDPAMVDAARARTAGLPVVDVRPGDIHDLALPGHFADRARTDRVLQHVADPRAALAEIRRVLRPGGRLVMGEPDWETLAVDHPDGELTRAYTRHVAERVVRNAAIGRQLARLATDAGFTVPEVVPVTPVFRDVQAADRILGLERTTRRAVAAGYFTDEAAESWLGHLTRGPFLATVTFYVVVAEA